MGFDIKSRTESNKNKGTMISEIEGHSLLYPSKEFTSSRVLNGNNNNKSKEVCLFSINSFAHNLNASLSQDFNKEANTTLPYDIGNCYNSQTNSSVLPKSHLRPILGIQIHGVRGRALIDTAAKRSIAGCQLYSLLREYKQPSTSTSMRVKLADGSIKIRQVLITNLQVNIKPGKQVALDFVVLPGAENNETLLGIDFLTAVGICIDFAVSTWKFSDDPKLYPLEFEPLSHFESCASADFLRGNEAIMLNPEDRYRLGNLLKENSDIFSLGGACTTYAEHYIDTGDHPPISVPPYRLTPAKKEIMKAELEKMLQEGIIEECESA
ncbi:unnamed protein product [Parnassius mnemosyne]|uniref:Uncharacterized protein n=1 Tax=Parnassius mnemosyne TaxID=213953 RepID=A0AAV1LRG6_9NEOP